MPSSSLRIKNRGELVVVEQKNDTWFQGAPALTLLVLHSNQLSHGTLAVGVQNSSHYDPNPSFISDNLQPAANGTSEHGFCRVHRRLKS